VDGTDCITVFPLVYHQWRVVVIRTIFLLNDKDAQTLCAFEEKKCCKHIWNGCTYTKLATYYTSTHTDPMMCGYVSLRRLRRHSAIIFLAPEVTRLSSSRKISQLVVTIWWLGLVTAQLAKNVRTWKGPKNIEGPMQFLVRAWGGQVYMSCGNKITLEPFGYTHQSPTFEKYFGVSLASLSLRASLIHLTFTSGSFVILVHRPMLSVRILRDTN
jgi:hypothetical protein